MVRLRTAARSDRPAARWQPHVAEADVVVLVLLGDLAERVRAVDEAEAALQPSDVDPVLWIGRGVDVRPSARDAEAVGRQAADLRAAGEEAATPRVGAHASQVAEAVVDLRARPHHLAAGAVGVE